MRHWTDAERALLGTMTDADLAATIGRTERAVRHERTHRGIPPHAPRAVNLTPDQISVIGTVSDAAAARMLGCSRQHVLSTRKRLGIPAAHPEKKPKTT